jgi:hypothetical protein
MQLKRQQGGAGDDDCGRSRISSDEEAVKVKAKLSHKKSLRLRRGMECRASILTLTVGTTRTAELSAVRAGRTLPPRKVLGTYLC